MVGELKGTDLFVALSGFGLRRVFKQEVKGDRFICYP